MASSHSTFGTQALPDRQRRANAAVYRKPSTVREYASQREMPCNEGVALLHYHAAFAGRDVLDVGVGAGRTARFLVPLAGRYECIDYSPSMVEFMQRTLPEVSTSLCDACDLARFADASFDMVFASNCVIDALSPADRLAALSEACRVLRPGGIYMFSSHNLRYEHARAEPRLVLEGTWFNKLRTLRSWIRQKRNHRRMRGLRRIEKDYALLNDTGHEYSLLHYYIDVPGQRRQLGDAGMQLLDVFNGDGRRLAEGDMGVGDLVLFYVARRVA